jgi:hypothetical protein
MLRSRLFEGYSSRRFCLAVVANFCPRKAGGSNSRSDFGKKIYETRPALLNKFPAGLKPKSFCGFFEGFVF